MSIKIMRSDDNDYKIYKDNKYIGYIDSFDDLYAFDETGHAEKIGEDVTLSQARAKISVYTRRKCSTFSKSDKVTTAG